MHQPTTQLPVLVEIEPHRLVVAVQVERRQPEAREMRSVIDLDHRPGRLVQEVDGKQEVLTSCMENRNVTLETSVDVAEDLERCRHGRDERGVPSGLRDAFEPDVPLLAQPVER